MTNLFCLPFLAVGVLPWFLFASEPFWGALGLSLLLAGLPVGALVTLVVVITTARLREDTAHLTGPAGERRSA